MPKQSQTLAVNSFVGGIITEASPLDFPENATAYEKNFVLDTDGTRRRRLGMDYESNHRFQEVGVFVPPVHDAMTSFSWEAVGDDSLKHFLVFQFGDTLWFYDALVPNITLPGPLGTVVLPILSSQPVSYAAVDGELVIASGNQEIQVVSWNEETGFLLRSRRLLVRDLWGVDDFYSSGTERLTIEKDKLTQEITFVPGATNTITCNDGDFDRFETASSGDLIQVEGTATNDGLVWTFLSYDTSTNTVSCTGPMNPETVYRPADGNEDPYVPPPYPWYVALYVTTSTGERFDLTSDNELSRRPQILSDDHLYNLRNQSFGKKRLIEETDTHDDPIYEVFVRGNDDGGGAPFYPSNADSVWRGLSFEGSGTDPREEFDGKLMVDADQGSSRAAQGFFIIDALERGSSREEVMRKNAAREEFSRFSDLAATYPEDRTPQGATQVVEFAGRIFYAGFGGNVEDGDSKSPKLSSYLLFSQLVESPEHINKCFQKGDPTSRDEGDIVATDGGFIRISGMRNCLGMKAVGDKLMVIAENGVWYVSGGSDYGFSAENYLVTKVTEYGALNSDSIIEVGNTLFYWSEHGIYQITPNELGDYTAVNITRTTIQALYDEIKPTDKTTCQGLYDKYTNRIRWLYGLDFKDLRNTEPVKELVLDLSLNAFYISEVQTLDKNDPPRVVGFIQTPAYSVGLEEDPVVVNGIQVVSGGEDVVIARLTREATTSAIKYVVAHILPGELQYGFTLSEYNDTNFLDLDKELEIDGIDATAEMLAGYVTGGDASRHKQVPYLIMHFRQTENGYEDDGQGGLQLSNPSSCLVRSQWDWTNDPMSGRWSRQFQTYKLPRHYIPTDINDKYTTGRDVITTKNKLRGRGKAFSLFITTEQEKDCQILGWDLSVNGNAIV